MSRRTAREPLDALFAEAARLHAASRFLARGLQMFGRSNHRRSTAYRAALAATALADVAVWRSTRRGRLPLTARIAVDLADVALWASVPDADLSTALASEIAVEIEGGLAWGLGGMIIPALEAAVSTLARKRRGMRPEADAHLPHLGAVVAGTALRWVEERRLERARDEHSAALSAKRVRAFLAGQHSVAMGACSVVDQLTPIAMIVGATGGSDALGRVRSGWKSELAAQSRRHALYLDEAVRLWEHEHNDDPDLSNYAIATVEEGDGTELLTGYQARALIELLDGLKLRGRVYVRLAERRPTSDRRPGRQLVILVDGTAIEVPADPRVPIVNLNVGPPVMLFAAWAALMPARKQDGGVPVGIAATCAGLWLAGARYSLRHTTDETAARQFTVGFALAALQGALYARTARCPRRPDGTQRYHGSYGAAPLLLLAAGNRDRMTRRERRAALAALGSLALASYRLADVPRSLVDFAAAWAWPMAAAVGSTGVRAATERQAAALVRSLEAEDDREERTAYQAGRAAVLELVSAAIIAAEAALRTAPLDESERSILQVRLAEVRDRAEGFVRESAHTLPARVVTAC